MLVIKKRIAISLFLFFIIGTAHAQVVYVDLNASGNNDGSSWADAYNELQDAIDNTSSGEIWVAQGTYYSTKDEMRNSTPADVREKTFRFGNNVVIYEGFLGNEGQLTERDWKNNTTILSGDIGTLNDAADWYW